MVCFNFYWQLGHMALLQTVLGRWCPDSVEQLLLGPWWWTVWLLRVQLCKCHACHAVILSHTYGISYLQSIFHGRNCDGKHLDATRLLLQRDHTVLQMHDLHQFRSLIQPAPWPGSRLWLGWLVHPIPFWGLGSTATGLQLKWSICRKVPQCNKVQLAR